MTHMLVSDDGTPSGVIDIDLINAKGTRFAFQLAAHCDDPHHLDVICQQTLEDVGPKAFGYVAASAARILAEHVLDPALAAGEAAGVHLRGGLLALAEGRDPSEAGR